MDSICTQPKTVLTRYSRLLTWIAPILWFASIPLGNSCRSIMMVMALVCLLITNPFRKLKPYLHTPWFYALSLAIIWCYLSFLWAPGIVDQTGFYLKKISGMWLFPMFILGFQEPLQKKWGLNLFLIAMLIPFICALFKYFGHWTWHQDSDPGLLFYNHIITGFYAAFAAFLALELFFSEKKYYYGFAWALFSFQVLFINTGKAAYVLYLILMTYSLWPRTSWKIKIYLCLSALLTFFMLIKMSHSLQNNIQNVMQELNSFQQQNFNTSLGFRYQFHHFAYHIWQQHWLIGGGIGAYDHQFTLLNPVPAWPYKPNTHSQYWLFAADFGLIGLGLWISFFLLLAKQAYHDTSPYSRIFMGFLIIFCFNLLTDNMLFASPVYLFMGLWAIAYPPKNQACSNM